MQQSTRSRRQFLGGAGAGLGAAWLAAHWPGIAAAHTHAALAAAAPAGTALEVLAPDEAALVEAIAAQVVPSDATPGAREAGAVHFIDRSLATWAAAAAAPLRTGVADFRARFAAAHPAGDFVAADAATQVAFLEQVEDSDFFGMVRTLTLLGMFASPAYGGNRDGRGWQLIGFDDRHGFAPPFGYYDRDYPGFVPPQAGA
jgi:hypothetical protein